MAEGGWGERKKPRVTVSVDPEILEWVKANSGDDRMFRNVDHAFQRAIRELKERTQEAEELIWEARQAAREEHRKRL